MRENILKTATFMSNWSTGKNGDFRTKTNHTIFEADYYGKGMKKYVDSTTWKQYKEFAGINLDRGWNRDYSSTDGNLDRIAKIEAMIDKQQEEKMN